MRACRNAGWAALAAVCLWLAGCANPSAVRGSAESAQPEGASGQVAKPGWATRTYAVAAANPLATEAGRQMLQAGGSAVDAAIAVQMVLTLVEPQSSGIGGGAFLLHFDGHQVQAYDGRETAPAGATPGLFLDANGQPMPFTDAVVGGRSVGVPGTVRMLALAHQRHGKLPWADLFEPAIALADAGLPGEPAHGHPAGRRSASGQRPGGCGLLLRHRWQALARRAPAAQPGAGRRAAAHCQRGARRAHAGRHRPGHGGQGAPAPHQSGHALAAGPAGLHAQSARTAVL